MHRSKWTGGAALLAAAAMVAAGAARAQSMTEGAISGTVFDVTEAAVPGATVVIHNDGSGANLTVKSGASGDFRAPLLAAGTYTVTITAPGFASSRQSNVTVAVNQVTQLNSHLTTGEATQQVEVTATQPVLQFDSPAFGGQLSNYEIENIPINNRRWSSLALTTPGVTNDASGFGLLSFRAIPAVLNNVQIDGVSDNQAFFGEERGRTRAGYSTSQVAVREFQVNTGVYSAELGRAVGGVVNSITKTGANQFHGEVYFYHRGDEFSSINPKVTIPTQNAAGAFVNQPFRPKDKRNQYGFGVGGPLIKDRLFWFYAFDAYRRNFPGVAVSGNPNVFNAPAVCTTALLAATGTTAAQCTAAFNDLSGDLGLVPRFGNQLINTPKLTWQINNKNTLNVYFHRLRWDSPGGVQTQAALAYARDAFGTDFVKLDYGVAKLDSVIGSHFTNEVRFQYSRELNDEGQQPLTDYTAAHFVSPTGNITYASISSSQGGFNAGSPYYSYRTANPDERKWQIGDTASYLLGRHTIRFGTDILHNYDLQNNLYQSNGSFSYSSPTLFLADILKPGGACTARTGSGTPSLSATGTAGCFSSLNQGFGGTTFDLATLDTAYFIQDDWKPLPNLTVNLGVRYDYEALPAPYSFAVAANAPQEANHPSDKNNISPRVGFAWDPFGQGKTVVRGGFGLYYGRLPNGVLLNTYINTGTTAGQTSLTVYNGTNQTPGAGTTYVKFPNILTARPSSGLLSTQYLSGNLQNPYTEQFDLAMQQDLGYRNILSVSYLGALGRELPNYINTNLDPANSYTASYQIAPNKANPNDCLVAACGTTFTQRVYSASTVNGTQNTLNPAYNGITDVLSNVNSSYNAFSVDITNRQWHWITFDANYTWAHALDYNAAQFTASGSNNWIDPFANPRSNYGNANINIRHRAVGWAILNIPGGQREGSALGYLANGWSVRPLVQIQSGLPYSASVSSGSAPSQCTGATCLQPWSTGVAGTGVSYIPFFGRNTLLQPRNIVLDARVQKNFQIREGMSFQLLAEGFNLANHQNVTAVNTGAYALTTTGGTATTPGVGTLTATTNFGQASSSGVNSNYAYQVRQLQFGARFVF